MSKNLSVPLDRIETLILFLRGEKVILDSELARLYGVLTGALNRAVRRNTERFPADFMFQLSAGEARGLKCQIGISKGRGGRRRSLPFAFTEQGVAMCSSVLRSRRAIAVNVEIMRAFVRLRKILVTHSDLARRIETLERISASHWPPAGESLEY